MVQNLSVPIKNSFIPPFYAMEIVEKKVIESDRTLDMVERAVQMVCAYMPDSIADRSVGACLKCKFYRRNSGYSGMLIK